MSLLFICGGERNRHITDLFQYEQVKPYGAHNVMAPYAALRLMVECFRMTVMDREKYNHGCI